MSRRTRGLPPRRALLVTMLPAIAGTLGIRGFDMTRRVWGLLIGLIGVGLAGCSGFGGGSSQEAAAVAGQYAPPSSNTSRQRAGVPEAAVSGRTGMAPGIDLNAAASDELLALLQASGRFDLIERVRLSQILADRGLSGMIQSARLIRTAAVPGIDYVMLGEVSGLSVRKEPPPDKLSVAGVENLFHISSADVPRLIVDGKVQLSLVNLRSGDVEVAGVTSFHRIVSPKAMGLQLTAGELAAADSPSLTTADARRVLRLMLDNAVRAALPQLDRWAASLPPPAAPVPPGEATVASATTRPATRASTTLAATVICPQCGARVPADEEFCPNCGHQLH